MRKKDNGDNLCNKTMLDILNIYASLYTMRTSSSRHGIHEEAQNQGG